MKTLNQRIIHLALPARMTRLPLSPEGYPVPYFVPWIDGKPEFRAMDGERFTVAIRHKRCWLCGEPLGVHQTFVLGPMCMVNRTNSEPPCHYDCARYAVEACPFLSQPRMRRNEKDKPEGHVAGFSIKRNPGVTVLWITRGYKLFRPPNGGILLEIGDPERVEFYAEGRPARRDEIVASMESGYPLLLERAEPEGPEAVKQLEYQYYVAMQLLPQETEQA